MQTGLGPDHTNAGFLRAIALRVIHACGASNPDEIIEDLEEEAHARQRRGASKTNARLWTLWQTLLICGYEIRDSHAIRPDAPHSGSALHPIVAWKLAFRSFRREWGIALTAALTLSIGFGAAGAIFSVLTGFTRDLPVPTGNRVVQIRVSGPRAISPVETAALLRAWTREQNTLVGIAGLRVGSPVLQYGEAPPVRTSAATITSNALQLLRVAPLLGGFREPTVGEETVVLSHSLWTSHFRSDSEVVGMTVQVNGRTHTVSGVMPEGFAFPYNQELWIPISYESMDGSGLEFFGRLVDGVSILSAAANLQTVAERQNLFADEVAGPPSVLVDKFTSARGEGGERIALFALLLVVVALLAVSCSNVSNLLIVRAIGRSRTMAVHAAIGAAPIQVALQLFVEALAIAVVGGLVGLGIAYLAVGIIEGALSGHWGYYWMRVGVDVEVVAFLCALALGTALLSGTIPALRAARADLVEPLKTENAGSTGHSAGWISWTLVTGQIIFSCIALVAAALMTNGLLRSRDIEPEFPANEVFVSTLTLDGEGHDELDRRRRIRQGIPISLASRPGVSAAAVSTGLPGMFAPMGRLFFESRPDDPNQPREMILTFAVTPDYFSVFDISLEDGRAFDESDGASTEPVAIVSQDFVKRHFPDVSPLDQRIRVQGVSPGEQWVRIVGVVSDVVIYDAYRHNRLDWIYFPLAQLDARTFYVVFRGPDNSVDATQQLQTAIWQLDPALPIGGSVAGDGAAPLTDILKYIRTIFETAGLLALLAGLGSLLVAAIGLYGIFAYEVRRRQPELGIRLALGAGGTRLQRMVLVGAAKKIGPGLALGLGIAYLIAPLFGVFLSGTNARDPLVFGTTCCGFLLVCFLATAIPAKKAASLDPSEVMRSE